MSVIWQIGSLLSIAVTLAVDFKRFPTVDDSPAIPIRKFRVHVCYMTNWINTCYCLHFDVWYYQIPYDGRQSCNSHTKIQIPCLLYDKLDQYFLLPSLWLLTLKDSPRWTTVLQSPYENSEFMFVIWQIRSILSIAVTLVVDCKRFPTMDDIPAIPIWKFRFHICYMTNWINTFYCLHFDVWYYQIPYDGRQSSKTHTKILISCLLYDKCDQYFLLSPLRFFLYADFLRWTTVLQNPYANSDFMFIAW